MLPDLFGTPPDSCGVIVVYHHALILSNDGAVIEVIDRHGDTVDMMEYGKTGGRLTARNGVGKAIADCLALHRTANVKGYCGLDSVRNEWTAAAVTPYSCREINEVIRPTPELDDDFSGTFAHASLPVGTLTRSHVRHAHLLTPRNSGNIIDDAVIETSYLDGLGRIRETVVSQATGPDRVTVNEYDTRGRKSKIWLPLPGVGGHGDFVGNITTLTASMGQFYGADNSPFSTITYEVSPQGRPTEEKGAGDAWRQHDGVRTIRHIGTATGRLAMLRVCPTEGGIISRGNYAAGDLTVTEVIDEDGHTALTYRDMDDSLVCVRRYFTALSYADTYYVRDLRGNIAYVLQPRLMAYVRTQMSTAGTTLADDADRMRQFAIVYKRDYRDRVIERRMPGAEPVYFVYDRSDLPVYTQDGNQREEGTYAFTAYDHLGRTAYSGVVEDDNDIATLRQVYRRISPRVDRASTGGVMGYSCPIDNVGESDILAVNYYDDYGFIANFAADSALTYVPMEGYGVKYEPARSGYNAAMGLATGGAVRAIGDGAMLPHAAYYDVRGREVQHREVNLKGGADVRRTAFSFTGKPLAVRHEHTTTDTACVDVVTYGYDSNDRLTAATMSHNGTDATLAAHVYDGLDRRCQSTLLGTTTIGYGYNVRGWCTAVSSPGAFAQTMKYADAPTPLYNGNVAEMAWGCEAVGERRFSYSYDGADRLTAARFNGSATGYYSCTYGYDTNGNITAVTRRGATECVQGGAMQYWTYGLIDDLTLTYDGNRLKKVTDQCDELTYAGAMDFRDGANSDSREYYWDANGNLTRDRNKGIIAIAYNALNLPERINFDNGHFTEYSYSADGRKLRTVYKMYDYSIIFNGGSAAEMLSHPLTITTRDYCGNYVYRNDTLERVMTDVGYIDGATQFHHAFVHDYQGNVRAVVRQDGTLVEYNAYYPYGMLMTGSAASTSNFVTSPTGSVQPYKYTGKELDRENGLDTYDFEARCYDPALATTWQQDPLADKYPQLSPYAWCATNPIKYVDPTGMRIVYDMSFDQFQTYYEQIELMKNSTLFSTYYQDLNNSEEEYIIKIDNNIKNGENIIFGTYKSENKTLSLNEMAPTITIAEEFYHAYQDDNSISRDDKKYNKEFEAKTAAAIVVSEVPTLLPQVYKAADNFFKNIRDFKFASMDGIDIISPSNLRLFQNEYIKYGTSFSQSYKRIGEYEYAKPVTGVPKLLLNTFQKSYKSWK